MSPASRSAEATSPPPSPTASGLAQVPPAPAFLLLFFEEPQQANRMFHSHTWRLRRDTWVEPHPAGRAGSHPLWTWSGWGAGLGARRGTREAGFISHFSSIVPNCELGGHLRVPFGGSCARKGRIMQVVRDGNTCMK